jgi:hypothetical protein
MMQQIQYETLQNGTKNILGKFWLGQRLSNLTRHHGVKK